MPTVQEMYRSKRGSAADALQHVRDGDMIIVPTGVGEPPTLLEALSAECMRFRDVQVAQILAMRKYGYMCATPRCSSAAPRVPAARAAGAISSRIIFPKSRP
jgi:acyl-CoA hydrolase